MALGLLVVGSNRPKVLAIGHAIYLSTRAAKFLRFSAQDAIYTIGYEYGMNAYGLE